MVARFPDELGEWVHLLNSAYYIQKPAVSGHVGPYPHCGRTLKCSVSAEKRNTLQSKLPESPSSIM